LPAFQAALSAYSIGFDSPRPVRLVDGDLMRHIESAMLVYSQRAKAGAPTPSRVDCAGRLDDSLRESPSAA
jgi:hypothetical protein